MEIDVLEPKAPGTREWVTQQLEGSCRWGKVGEKWAFPLPEGESERVETKWKQRTWYRNGPEQPGSATDRQMWPHRARARKGSGETWRDGSLPLQLLLKFLAPIAGGPQLQLQGSDRFLRLPRT